MATESPENLIPVIKPTFFCQKCYQPLRLDPTFLAIDEKMLTELNASVSSQDEKEFLSYNQIEPNIEKTATDLAHPERTVTITAKKYTAPCTGHSSLDSGNGFMLIDNLSNSSNSQQLSQHFRHSALLFDIISGHSNVDHPLCEECTDALLDQMDQQLRITEDECKEYRDFLEQLESGPMEDQDMKALEEDLEKLKLQEQMLMEQLQMIENERVTIGAEVKKVEEEEKKIKEDEERYYREYVHYKRQLLEYEDEHRSVDNQLKYANSQLDKLRKTNVFNATFHIWHSGHFGTINNFRLGRLPSVPVEWHEINAAWGQAVLLLHALARKMNLEFQRYRLVPYGNHSYIESLTDRTKQLRLYGSGGFSFLWDTKFDSGMVAFLDCLQQFKEQVEKGDTGFCLPYRMERGRVEDSGTGSFYSIKIQFNSEEQWTKALKFMLTNLKWGLAWVSSQFASE